MGIKYQVNSSFFEKWTPEMAYILGYIFADGSLEDASYLRGKYLRITSKDEEILLKIKKILNSSHKLQLRKPIKINFKKSTYFSKVLYLLRIGDHKIFDDLINLGVTTRKSLTLKFPEIPTLFFPHFVRGYFDGDGSVFLTKNNLLLTVFTCGNSLFLENLSEKLSKFLQIKKRPVLFCKDSYQLRYYTHDSKIVLDKIYEESNNLFLNRKNLIYKNYYK